MRIGKGVGEKYWRGVQVVPNITIKTEEMTVQDVIFISNIPTD